MADQIVACPSCSARNRVPVSASGHPRCPKCRTDLPWLVEAGDGDFSAAVDTSVLVLVDLWAPWCPPCRQVAPVLDRLSREFAGRLKVVKVNVDDSPGLSRRFQATSIPMLVFLRAEEPVETVIGAQPEHVLRATVNRLLG